MNSIRDDYDYDEDEDDYFDDEEEVLPEDEIYPGMKKEEYKRLYTKYPYVYAWGKFMRSQDFYIGGQMEEAEFDDAPEGAIYKKNGVWQVVSKDKKQELDPYLPK